MKTTAIAQPLAAAVLVAGLALVSASRAAAEPVPIPETGAPGYLSIAAEPVEIQFPAISPGTTGYAAIDLRLSDAQWADASFVVETDGAAMTHPSGALLEVRACDRPWDGLPSGSVASDAAGPTCTSGTRTLLPPTPGARFTPSGADAGSIRSVGQLRSRTPEHLMLSLALPTTGASDDSLQGLAGDFLLRFTAEGDQSIVLPEEPEPGGPVQTEPGREGDPSDAGDRDIAGPGGGLLATTGATLLGWLLAGAGLVAFGAVAFLVRRREVA